MDNTNSVDKKVPVAGQTPKADKTIVPSQDKTQPVNGAVKGEGEKAEPKTEVRGEEVRRG